MYEYIFHSLNKKLGNISLNYRLVNLSINGVDYGLYSIEEGFSNELLEKIQEEVDQSTVYEMIFQVYIQI